MEWTGGGFTPTAEVAVQFNADAGRALKKGPRAYIADAMRVIVGELEKKRAA